MGCRTLLGKVNRLKPCSEFRLTIVSHPAIQQNNTGMSLVKRRRRGIQVSVQPLFELTSRGSTSLGSVARDDFAYAPPTLWDQLSRIGKARGTGNSSSVIGIAIEWPRDNRLRSKGGTRKSSVLWVKPREVSYRTGVLVIVLNEQGSAADASAQQLFVPAAHIPRYFPTPLSARVYLHEPIELGLVVLQPVVHSDTLSDSTQLSVDDIDLSRCYRSHSEPLLNGYTNGYHLSEPSNPSSESTPPRIFRRGDTVLLPRRHGSEQAFKVLVLDPVHQGIINPTTRVVLSTTPHTVNPEANWDEVNDAVSESSHGRTHLSLANFDPDAFLSSALDMRLPPSSPLEDGPTTDDFFEHSSTSGSITPRPGTTAQVAPSSPPAPVDEVLAESEVSGTRFSVIVAAGPSPDGDDENACWMGVGGLGRAGIFEGDWVHIRPPLSVEGSNSGRLVRCLAWEQLDEDEPEM